MSITDQTITIHDELESRVIVDKDETQGRLSTEGLIVITRRIVISRFEGFERWKVSVNFSHFYYNSKFKIKIRVKNTNYCAVYAAFGVVSSGFIALWRLVTAFLPSSLTFSPNSLILSIAFLMFCSLNACSIPVLIDSRMFWVVVSSSRFSRVSASENC